MMMSPAQKKTLTGMITAGELDRVPVDPGPCRALLEQAEKHLLTATAGLDPKIADSEGAFTLAYDACRKTSLALVMSTGYRPAGPSEHMATFEAAAEIAAHFGMRTIVDDAADLRRIRHGAQYRGEVIRPAEAQEAITIADELQQALTSQIEKALAASGH